jgi:hypothetical protein
MFQVRAKTEIIIDALWVAAGWKGKYTVTVYCTDEHQARRAWPMAPKLAPRKKLVELTVNEVSSLLDSLDLSKYRNKWADIPINGARLSTCLDGEDMPARHDNLKKIGVQFEGHRDRILAVVHEFMMDGVPLDILSEHGALDACKETKADWMKVCATIVLHIAESHHSSFTLVVVWVYYVIRAKTFYQGVVVEANITTTRLHTSVLHSLPRWIWECAGVQHTDKLEVCRKRPPSSVKYVVMLLVAHLNTIYCSLTDLFVRNVFMQVVTLAGAKSRWRS